MSNNASLSGLGMKAVALVALLVCAWILLKIVIGVVTAVAWFVVVVAAIVGVVWAMSVLRR